MSSREDWILYARLEEAAGDERHGDWIVWGRYMARRVTTKDTRDTEWSVFPRADEKKASELFQNQLDSFIKSGTYAVVLPPLAVERGGVNMEEFFTGSSKKSPELDAVLDGAREKHGLSREQDLS